MAAAAAGGRGGGRSAATDARPSLRLRLQLSTKTNRVSWIGRGQRETLEGIALNRYLVYCI